MGSGDKDVSATLSGVLSCEPSGQKTEVRVGRGDPVSVLSPGSSKSEQSKSWRVTELLGDTELPGDTEQRRDTELVILFYVRE